MITYNGFKVEKIEIDFTGFYPGVTIYTKKSGRPHIIRNVSFLRSVLMSIEKEIKEILNDEK